MDSPSRPSGPSGLSNTDSASSDPQTTLSRDTIERATDNTFDGQGHDILRRGHSDGDVLNTMSTPHRHTIGRNSANEGETWMDFLRESPSNGEATQEWAQAATKRVAIMAADRKRRMMVQHSDFDRRRSASSISSGQTANARIPQIFSPAPSDAPFARPRRPQGNHNSTGSIERPPYRLPSMADVRSRRNREIVLPRWQPDTEVSKCPICGTIFSFWYRKHHCRKCGRVVCANCSPHRITIPRQFIVHPPTEIAPGSANSNIINLTRDDSEDLAPPRLGLHGESRPRSQDYHLDPALGGGQEVRLCNPCVPDPNPLPPPAYPSPVQHSFSAFPSPDGFAAPLPGARTLLSHTPPAVVPVTSPSSGQVPELGDTYRQDQPIRHESNAAPNSMDRSLVPGRYEGLEEFLLRQRGRGPTFDPLNYSNYAPVRSNVDGATTAGPAVNRRHSHAVQPSGAFPFPPRYSSMDNSMGVSSTHNHHIPGVTPQSRHRHNVSASSVPPNPRYRSMLDTGTPPLRRALPQPQLREEDECPICHCALPPKGTDGSETAREAHVAACIESHFSSSTARTSHPPPALATAAAVSASAGSPSQAGATSSAAASGLASGLIPRRRAGGMVVYHASEKDCVGEDGEGGQECVICFEEFAVGDEMGRLECLCKFHKACIRQWWDTKGAGACPVHQGGL